MVIRDREIKNAARREHLSQQSAKTKSKAKLSRRLEIKKAEAADSTGELKRKRLEENVPRTIEGTREWVGGSEQLNEDSNAQEGGDARTRPVRIKAAAASSATAGGGGDNGEIELDMAGLEDLFNSPAGNGDADHQARGPILLTTSPRPHGPTYAFLNELQSLLGGKKYAEVLPRKNARFELSRVVKWAKKRGYSAIMVVGEDLKGEPGERASGASERACLCIVHISTMWQTSKNCYASERRTQG